MLTEYDFCGLVMLGVFAYLALVSAALYAADRLKQRAQEKRELKHKKLLERDYRRMQQNNQYAEMVGIASRYGYCADDQEVTDSEQA